MLTSYNLWYTKKDDDTSLFTEVAVRFCEGEITTEDELVVDQQTRLRSLQPVTRYRVQKQLSKEEIAYVGDRLTKNDFDGNECILFFPGDFGKTGDVDAISCFLNGVLRQDPSRTPIDEQSETDLTILKELRTQGL